MYVKWAIRDESRQDDVMRCDAMHTLGWDTRFRGGSRWEQRITNHQGGGEPSVWLEKMVSEGGVTSVGEQE